MPIPRTVPAAKGPWNRWLRSIAAAVIVGVSFVAGWMTHRTRLESRPEPLLVRDSEMAPVPRASEPSDVGDVATQGAGFAEDRVPRRVAAARMVRTVGLIRFGPESLAGGGAGTGWARDHGGLASGATAAGLGVRRGRPAHPGVSSRAAATILHDRAGRRTAHGHSGRSCSDSVHRK